MQRPLGLREGVGRLRPCLGLFLDFLLGGRRILMVEWGDGGDTRWTSHCHRLQLHKLLRENSINNLLCQCLVINFLNTWRFAYGNIFL